MFINFSALSPDTLLGKMLRLPLKVVPPRMIIPILQGRLKGRFWIRGSSNDGCWLGSYERKKTRLFEKTVTGGSVVFDIGANVGYYTLLASLLVGPGGKVFSFEPVPRNLFYLRKHLAMNRLKNVTVFEEAASDTCGEAVLMKVPITAWGIFQSRAT